ncbi:hypothetical protein HOR91_gp37 [Xanthomonas phage phi Xc10]|uniref:Uncharacterized protein n=1 Tax=Xanthomonas phage phi Xc10 TaxID=2024237 RepID=A0A249XLR0_9CAUD|nr:hypothetical protein HOR91_gp37 [Xanthomonas phage phi Xc10]ASZ72036.1 hypothetical protein [Xanthomonas phage phi Xc10]
MVFDRPFEISNRVVAATGVAGLPANSVGTVVGVHYDAIGAGWVVRVRFVDDEIGSQDVEYAPASLALAAD